MKVFRLLNGFFTLLAGLGLVLGGLLNSCAGGADSGGAQQTGTVAVLLTDGPADNFLQVNVTVTEVSLLSNEGGQVTIFSDSRRVNLLDFQDVEDLFMIHDGVQAGIYHKIRLQVSDPELVSLDGQVIPSNQINLVANGKIDLVPEHPFSVSPGETLSVRLDMDANKAILIHTSTNGTTYEFRPVIFVEVSRDLPTRHILVEGVINSIDSSTHSFLLQRTDPIFHDLGDGDVDRPHLIRVVVSDETHIFNASGIPATFDSLQESQEVHVRGLLALQGGPHINAKLIEIGQITHRRGAITSSIDSNNRFGLRPDGCQDTTCEIEVQVYDETLIFEAGTHNPLGPQALVVGRRVGVEGVLDESQDPVLLHAAVIVVKPDEVEPTHLEGIINDDLNSADRTFSITTPILPPCDPPHPCLELPQRSIKVHVMDNALIIRIHREEDGHFSVEVVPFESLKAGDMVQLFGYFDVPETQTPPFHALVVLVADQGVDFGFGPISSTGSIP